MSAQFVMDEFVAEQGWNNDTQLSLLLEYVDNQSDDNGFREFLQSFVEEYAQDEKSLWCITFFDGSYGYVKSDSVAAAIGKLLNMPGCLHWNQNLANPRIKKIELVEDGFGPEVKHGWYSGSVQCHSL